MVKAESYKFKDGFTSGGKVWRRASGIEMKLLERAANGSWFATLNLTLEFNLADGRTVTVNKQVRLRGAQEGKRPHPDPFGWKKKKKGKRVKLASKAVN